MASDNADDKDNDNANSRDVEVVETCIGEALAMLDKLINLR